MSEDRSRQVRTTAPEVLKGGPRTASSDVFQFGVLMYEFITKTLPFSEYNDDYALRKLLNGDRPDLDPELHPLLANLVRKCWAHEATNRPLHGELMHELQVIAVNGYAPWSTAVKEVNQMPVPESPLAPLAVTTKPGTSQDQPSPKGTGEFLMAGNKIREQAQDEQTVSRAGTLVNSPGSPSVAFTPASHLSLPGVFYSRIPGHKVMHDIASAVEQARSVPFDDWSEDIFDNFVRCMRDTKEGLDVRDRYYHLIQKRWCFVGQEAVAWIMNALNITAREEAVRIAQKIMDRDVFVHVSKSPQFRDENTFYRFTKKRQVIIIGGGFAGSKAAQMLEKEAYMEITLIDTKPFFQCTPSLPASLVDPAAVQKISAAHTSYLKTAKVITGKVAQIVGNMVCLEDGSRLPYEILLLCTGSRYEMPFQADHVVNCIDYNTICDRYGDLVRAKKVCVIGGGLVGTEVTGEIASRFPEKQIQLVTRSRFLGRCTDEAHSSCTNLMAKFKNVNIIMGEAAISLEGRDIVTDKGTRIQADIVYPCLGGIPNTDCFRSAFKDSMTSTGYMKINPKTFQLETHENVFALGDIADIKEEKLAQSAEDQAETVVRNVRLLDAKQPLAHYDIPSKRLLIISVGPNKALMVNGETVITEGMIASKVKSIVGWKIMRRVV